METFFLFGKYSKEALDKISADRTRKAINTIQKLGGRVKSAYALLGDRDQIRARPDPQAARARVGCRSRALRSSG